MEIIFILLLFITPFAGYLIYDALRPHKTTATKLAEFISFFLFILFTGLFCFGLMIHAADYYEAIDIIDNGYTPIASKHLLTPVTFFILALWGLARLWLKGRQLPPLLLVLALCFVFIGIIICIIFLVQISSNSEQTDIAILLAPLPLTFIVTAAILTGKIITAEAKISGGRIYHNKILNYLNQIMGKAGQQPLWALILLTPVFFIIVCILILFGQDINSIAKAFTDTATWTFSQKVHPPFLDHRGHYLCTVAACGSPGLVKPVRMGKRHGHTIIVNRQLQVANAFEELLQEKFPTIHNLVRKLYDKYGYPLSKKINTPKRSDITYLLMKPAECFFLVILYLTCMRPEEKIGRQYALQTS